MKTKLVILILAVITMVFGDRVAFAEPNLQAMISHNWISGFSFPADTEINVQLQNSQGGQKGNFPITTDNNGNFFVDGNDWPNQFLVRGDQIQTTFESQTVSMVVQNLTATVNIDENEITGIAVTPEPQQALVGRKVQVHIQENWGPNPVTLYQGETLVQSDGSFIFNDLTGFPYQLSRGHAIFMTLFDAPDGTNTGNMTSIEPYNGIPHLEAWFKNNRIDGSGFPFNSPVTVVINGDPNKTKILQSDSGGNFSFHVWELNHPLGFGDTIIAMTQDNLSASLTITVLPILLETATADPVANRIYGEAPELSGKTLLIRFITNTGPHENTVAVEVDGTFSKLTDYDFISGEQIGLGVSDDSGDIVFFDAYNGIPVMSTMIEHNWISGSEFPPNTLLAIALSDGTNANFTISTDNRGSFWANNDLWNHQPLVRGGDIQITWGDSGSLFAEIQNFSATVDISGNRVTGIALTPDGQQLNGNRVDLWVSDNWSNPPMYYAIPAITDNGVFTFDFNGTGYTLQAGHNLFLTLYESTDGSNSGNQTSTSPYNGIRRLEVSPDHNWINGWDFPFNSPLILTIDPVNSGTNLTANLTSDSGGNFNKNVFEFNSYKLQPGDVVTVAYGVGQSISVTVPSVTVSVNAGTNIISGTAPGFQTIRIAVYSMDQSTLLHEATVIVDGGGQFSLEWPGLEPGMGIYLSLTDSLGNTLTYHGNNPMPGMRVHITGNQVHGLQWPLGAMVTLTIDNPANGVVIDYTDTQTAVIAGWDPNSTVVVFQLGNFMLQSGHTVKMSSGSTTKTHTVTSLSVTEVDPDADTVSGTAAPDSLVEVGLLCDNMGCAGRQALTGQDGNWMVDFSQPGVGSHPNQQYLYDIIPGTASTAVQCDEDGDCTQYAWNVPNPYFYVWMTQNNVNGYQWPLGAMVTLTIDDPSYGGGIDHTDTQTAVIPAWDPNSTFVLFQLGNFTLQPGQIITMSSGSTTKTHTVTSLVVTGVDPDADTVSGTAAPGSLVEVGLLCDNTGCAGRQTVTGQDGNWMVDFSQPGVGSHPNQQYLYDIIPGTISQAGQSDEDGDCTRCWWYAPNPRLEVSPDHNWINGYQFPFNSQLVLTIDPVDSGTNLTANLTTDFNGFFNKNVFDFNSHHLQPGDVVTVSYGVGQSISVTVPSVTVTVNADTNIISGTAPGFQTIRIVIYSQDRRTLLHEATVNVDENGNFSLEWSGLESGQSIDLFLTDANGNTLSYHGYNPIPILTAMITHNWISGDGFPVNTPGTLTVNQGPNGIISINGQTDANGYFFADGNFWPGRRIAIGDVIDAVIGSAHATMTVQDLHAIADAEANRIAGSAKTPSGQFLSGRRVDVSISPQGGGSEIYHQSTSVDQDGNFELNLNSLFDLQVGHRIFLTFTDDPSGNTWGHRTCIAPFNDPKVVRASVTSNNYVDGSFRTSFDLYVWADPNIVIDDMYIDGPSGRLPYSKQDFQGWPTDPTYFWFFIDGPPALGTYTFHVVSNGVDVTAQDSQNVNRTMPIPDFITPENGDILTSSTPTIEWTAVSHPDTTVYYRLVIDDMNGNRIFSTSRQAGMLSAAVPENLLHAGQSYIIQIRTSDSTDWILTQNVGRGYCNITIAAGSKGDINGDGFIDLADGILALKVLAGYPIAGISPDSDVNGDGKIGMAEAIYVLQLLGGLR